MEALPSLEDRGLTNASRSRKSRKKIHLLATLIIPLGGTAIPASSSISTAATAFPAASSTASPVVSPAVSPPSAPAASSTASAVVSPAASTAGSSSSSQADGDDADPASKRAAGPGAGTRIDTGLFLPRGATWREVDVPADDVHAYCRRGAGEDRDIRFEGRMWKATLHDVAEKDLIDLEQFARDLPDEWRIGPAVNVEGYGVQPISADGPYSSVWGYLRFDGATFQAIVLDYHVSGVEVPTEEDDIKFECPCTGEYSVFLSRKYTKQELARLLEAPGAPPAVNSDGRSTRRD